MSLSPLILRQPARLAARLAVALSLALGGGPLWAAEAIAIAAAADLQFAMDEIVARFGAANPGADIQVSYGSSGKFHTQIRQGAPFDLFFSADIAFPRELVADGLTSGNVRPYAVGRIVLWSTQTEASKLTLKDLTAARFSRIAIANPRHAPYGTRAEEALRASGVWARIEPRLVYGENIAQTAQYVATGNAQVGIIALSLAVNPDLARRGGYALIPEDLHTPLEQGFVITRRARGNALARRFADFMDSGDARQILALHGFTPPEATAR